MRSDDERHVELVLFLRRVGALSVTLVEALHTTTRIYKLLLTGEERMALVAQFKRERAALAAAGGELVAT